MNKDNRKPVLNWVTPGCSCPTCSPMGRPLLPGEASVRETIAGVLLEETSDWLRPINDFYAGVLADPIMQALGLPLSALQADVDALQITYVDLRESVVVLQRVSGTHFTDLMSLHESVAALEERVGLILASLEPAAALEERVGLILASLEPAETVRQASEPCGAENLHEPHWYHMSAVDNRPLWCPGV